MFKIQNPSSILRNNLRELLPTPPRPETLLQAGIDRIVEHAPESGVSCPCCGQFAKVYKRALSSSMAVWLIWLVREWEEARQRWDGGHWVDGDCWVSIHDGRLKQTRGGDYAKLVYWDLIRPKPNDDPKKRNSGLWQPTPYGIDFVRRRIQVPSHVLLYDGKKIGAVEKHIFIEDALGKKFDYQELMKA